MADAGKEIDGETETLDEDDDEEKIDYGNLPPAIPRDGARSRKPMLSDPITVLHVGPMRDSLRLKGSPLVKEVEGSVSSGAAAPSAAANATVPTATAPTADPPPRLPPRLSSRESQKPRVQGSLRGGSEERDSLAEKWLKRMIRGVDVERWVGPAVAVAVDGKGKKGKKGKGWRWRFWS